VGVVAFLSSAVLLAAACGSTGDKKDDAASSTTPSTAETTTTVPKVLERSIAKTVWWDGFEISVDELKAEPQAGSGTNLSIDVTWKNLGDEPASPPQPLLDNDGEVISPSASVGEAAGQASVSATLAAYIPSDSPNAKIDPAKVTDALKLTWGQAGDNQSIVPLDEDTEPTTFEPKEVAGLAGTITTPTVVIDVTDGGYTWSYASGQKDKFVLKARIKITCPTGGCPDEGTAMSLADLTLTVPGSSTPISPSDDDSEFCCEAVYPGTVSDDPSNTVAFVVEDEPSGSYKLTYNPDRSEPVPGSLDFTI
jgi:hypothetical protein